MHVSSFSGNMYQQVQFIRFMSIVLPVCRLGLMPLGQVLSFVRCPNIIRSWRQKALNFLLSTQILHLRLLSLKR